MAGLSPFGSRGSSSPNSYSTAAVGGPHLPTLEAQCYSYLAQGLAASTRKSYATAQSQFLSFCRQLGRIHSSGSPCPADEWTLCLFATFLAGSLQHSSIKVYLSGVRALHIEQGFADPLHNCLRLQRVIRGIKRTQGSPSSNRLPITDDLMLVIRKSLNLQLPDHCMFWAACTRVILGFYSPRNLQSLLWQVSPLRFIWACRILQWTPAQLLHASTPLSRLSRQIRSARAAPFILAWASIPYALFTRYWPIWLSGVMGRALCFFVKTGNLSDVLYSPTGFGKSWPLLEFLVIFQATASE